MIKEIEAKTILSPVKQPDTWFGLKYSMNLYRGCQHRCIYCDSRSECYGIDGFDREILVKSNAVELLRDELSRKRVRGTIGTGSMNDPYMPLERTVRQTGRALKAIVDFRFPVHVLTKSDLVLRDLGLLQDISKVYAAVSFTITCADDALGRQLEPGAPRVSKRFAAMRDLAEAGIYTGILLMPVLPFIEDDAANIEGIVRLAADHGAKYILPSFGMTMRDRQRAYYYSRLDEKFPGLRQRYQRRYGNDYACPVPNADELDALLSDLSQTHGITRRMKIYEPQSARQPSLF
jgi:DNA repair photolyase